MESGKSSYPTRDISFLSYTAQAIVSRYLDTSIALSLSLLGSVGQQLCFKLLKSPQIRSEERRGEQGKHWNTMHCGESLALYSNAMLNSTKVAKEKNRMTTYLG